MGYLLIVNASRIDADAAWLEEHLSRFPTRALVTLVNASDQRAAVAVQGPKVAQFIDACFPGPAVAGRAVERPSLLKKNEIAAFRFGDGSVWVGRHGLHRRRWLRDCCPR